GTIFAAGFAALGLAGGWHQDRKLLRLRGESYAHYLAATSTIPFAAIVSGRQHLVWREVPFGSLVAGVAIAFLLRARHDALFAHGGLWLIVAVLGGAAVEMVQGLRRGRRAAARAADSLTTRPDPPARGRRPRDAAAPSSDRQSLKQPAAGLANS